MPDGTWESRQYLEVLDEVYKVNLKMTKTGDELVFDFTGSSPQSKYSVNCTKWASLGGLFAPLFPLICYDITWNEGCISPIKMIAPEGSIVNCTRPAPVSVATVGAIQSVNNAACTTIGKMLQTSEKYAREATSVWHANHFAIFKFGRSQRGGDAIGIFTETFAGSGGARTYADGVDVGGEIPNPISRMANVETVENTFPIRYLFRRRMKDSGGPGKYRGGTGMEFAVVQHDSPDGGLHYVVSGKGANFPMSEGLAGGYPGAPNAYQWVHNNDAEGTNIDVRACLSVEEMPGDKEDVTWGVFPLMGDDALYVRWNGGGGYGDPLDRDPDAVVEDVRAGIVSTDAAHDVYGVALNPAGDGHHPDDTAALRKAMRRTRLRAEAAE